MREPSLRPERSASANSATSAFFLRTEFYLKDYFCQPERWHGHRHIKDSPLLAPSIFKGMLLSYCNFFIWTYNDINPKAQILILSRKIFRFRACFKEVMTLSESFFPTKTYVSSNEVGVKCVRLSRQLHRDFSRCSALRRIMGEFIQ